VKGRRVRAACLATPSLHAVRFRTCAGWPSATIIVIATTAATIATAAATRRMARAAPPGLESAITNGETRSIGTGGPPEIAILRAVLWHGPTFYISFLKSNVDDIGVIWQYRLLLHDEICDICNLPPIKF
jgi:hypothetical protein